MKTKRMLQIVVPLLVVLTMLAAQVAPVYAAGEPPPPGSEPKTKGGPASAPQPEKPRPPASAPDKVAPPVQAAYQSDGLLEDARGDPVKAANKITNVLPLASQVTICPPGVFPDFLGGTGLGCNTSYTTLSGAISAPAVVANWGVFAPANAVPYVETVTISKSINVMGEDAAHTTINGDVVFTAGNASLQNFTISGGQVGSVLPLSGLLRLADLNITSPAGEAGIWIQGHKGSVELIDIWSEDNEQGAYIDTSAGSGSVTITNAAFIDSKSLFGLKVLSKGAVTLNNVRVSGTQAFGTGADLTFGSSLTIRKGSFFNNGGAGLLVMDASAAGKVTLQSVSSSANQGEGAIITANGAISIDKSRFNSNLLQGLAVTSNKGPLTITGSEASDSITSYGAKLVAGAGGVSIYDSLFGYSLFPNHGQGLEVKTSGPVTLNYVKAGYNLSGGGGALVDNSGAAGAKPVTVLNSSFSYNTGTGLKVTSLGGITMQDVVANSNTGATSRGAHLDNCFWNGATNKCRGSGNVTITSPASSNSFSTNGSDGLLIFTKGNVALSNIYNAHNGGSGLYLDACNLDPLFKCTSSGTLSLTDDNFYHNAYGGVYAWISGNSALTRVVANDNQGNDGVVLGNGSLTPKTTTITASEFRNNDGGGLTLISQYNKGAITLNYVKANDNHTGTGAYLNVKGPVSILNTLGDNQFNHNGMQGLDVISDGGGAVIANGITASDNDFSGALIYSLSSVTMNGAVIKNNLSTGLWIEAKGNVSLNKLDVSLNGDVTFGGGGAVIDSSAAVKPATVTITNSTFNTNKGHGLMVLAKGNISLNHIGADYNTGSVPVYASGVWLDNCLENTSHVCQGSGSVSLLSTLGSNYLDSNDGSGLVVKSKGSITLNGVNAYGSNHRSGVELYNQLGAGNAAITVNFSAFQANAQSGLLAASAGVINLTKSYAIGNLAGNGFDLDNSGALAAPGVNISLSYASTNQGDYSAFQGLGFLVMSKGSITLNGVKAYDNQGYGILMDNCIEDPVGHTCKGSGNVEFKNTLANNFIDRNNQIGLVIASKGSIKLEGVFASSSPTGSGAQINNSKGTADVTINNSKFDTNFTTGLTVISAGNITLYRVEAVSNAVSTSGDGAWLANTGSLTTTKSITINQSIFSSNENGLVVQSKGAITLNNVTANGNSLIGASINNCLFITACLGAGNVTLLSTLGPNQFSYNGQNGLAIETNGNITAGKLYLDANGQGNPADPYAGAYFQLRKAGSTAQITCGSFTQSGGYGLDVLFTAGAGNLLTLKGTLLWSNHQTDGLTMPEYRLLNGNLVRQPALCP